MGFADECSISEKEEPLYDPRILQRLDLKKAFATFEPAISIQDPGDGLLVRPLCAGDYEKGFLQLLSQLTAVGDISEELFLKRFNEMKSCPGTYYVTVVEDRNKKKIVGAASLVVEQKFIHGCAVRGRLEDVVVSDEYRGKQLGKLIISTINLLAQELKCYKITLDCNDQMVSFYKKLGYILEPGKANYMTIRFSS